MTDTFDLPNRDILHLNVILITGVLIFMTVSSYAQVGSYNEYRSVFQIVAPIIAAFSISSILLIWSSFKCEKWHFTQKNIRIWGTSGTVLGLILLITFSVQLAFR